MSKASTKRIKPILKYRGGKAKELDMYLKYIPSFKKYYEPFFGGGATFFALKPRHARIGDINHKLISFYKDIVEEYAQTKIELKELQNKYEYNRKIFISRKKEHQPEHVEDPNDLLYYTIRDMFNEKIESKYTFATLYYFINKTAYSGMIRYNKKGEFNVPYGRYANFNTDLLNESQYNLLKDAEIVNESYETSFALANHHDFL